MEVITLGEVSRAGLRLRSLSKIGAHETRPVRTRLPRNGFEHR